MNKPPDETLKQGRNRSWLLIKLVYELCFIIYPQLKRGNRTDKDQDFHFVT